MSAYQVYPIRPIERGMSTEKPSLFVDPAFSPWIQNCRCDKGAVEKCWGYSIDRTIGRPIYGIYIYAKNDGSRYTLYLTDTDLIQKETATNKTWSYKTEMWTTDTIASMNAGPSPAAKTVVTKNAGTTWVGNVAAGDMFVVDADLTADEEPSTKWATIASVDSANQITLTSAYTGATTSGAYRIRKVYSLPSGERWSAAIVNNTFCFGNGNTIVQKYTGTGYASNLETAATYTINARYMMEFANRLVIADVYTGATRLPLTFRWSKEDDPTDWTDTTAGEADILETGDTITGLGRVGTNMVVFKSDSLHFYARTGTATDPFNKTGERRGIGCIAPYSIVPVQGTCAFIWKDDFYIINGDQAEGIGGNVEDKYFDMTDTSEVKKTWGGVNPDENEVMWFANTLTGRYVFVWNYAEKAYYIYSYPDEITAYGVGAI